MPAINPIIPNATPLSFPPVTSLTDQQIQQYLLWFPTPNSMGSGNTRIWQDYARTSAGQSFLRAHAENRRAAKDTGEADSILSALTSAINPLSSKTLPPLPSPLPSRNATSVARAIQPLPNPQSTFNIPLLKQPTQTDRLSPLPTPTR